MIVNGPETERDDGSVVCIGYFEDVEGRVIERFALPKKMNHPEPPDYNSVQYVEAMDQLPPKDDHHRDSS